MFLPQRSTDPASDKSEGRASLVAVLTRLTWRLVRVLAAVIAMGVAGVSYAIAPPHVTDAVLAGYPVIVEAHWEANSKITPHEKIEGNTRSAMEAFTDLVVDRVVAGDLKTGRHRLRIGAFIGWSPDGRWPRSTMSTEMPADVQNVTDHNLWLLSWGRSWDAKDGNEYLTLDTYRGMQPLALEPLFVALRSGRAEAVAGLLAKHQDPVLAKRVLLELHGGSNPWPYYDDFEGWAKGKPDPAQRRPEFAAQVEPLLTAKDADTRRMAAAVFASLRGAQSVPQMRSLLADPDSGVRGIAIGELALYKDEASIAAMNRGAVGVEDPVIGCAMVERLVDWGDQRLVPALISLLQNDRWASRLGDDWQMPAIRSRAALAKLTGFTFPLEVAASQKAWAAAQAMEGAHRVAFLEKELGDHAHPWLAEKVDGVIGLKARIRVTNKSDRPLELARLPYDIYCYWDQGGSGHDVDRPTSAASYIRLAPGESYTFKVRWPDSAPPTARASIFYSSNGNAFGVNAWVGVLQVKTR